MTNIVWLPLLSFCQTSTLGDQFSWEFFKSVVVFHKSLGIMLRKSVRTTSSFHSAVSSARAFSQFGNVKLPPVKNEPMHSYAPGTAQREMMKKALERTRSECPDIPCIINGEEVRTGNVSKQLMPSNNSQAICTYHKATPEVIQNAIKASMSAKAQYEAMPAEERLAIFTKASWLLSKVYRYDLNAATMLGQGKTVWQAEIDAAAELIDFWRFGAKFVEEMYSKQQDSLQHDDAIWNRLEFRPLEGFCLAISPFNFTAIGGNLCATPAMLGNTGLWKPSSTSILANYVTYKVLVEAGLPPGVINFIPSSGKVESLVASSCCIFLLYVLVAFYILNQ